MSRIGKQPITIPEGVEVKIENNKVSVKGPKGSLEKEFSPLIKVEIENKLVSIGDERVHPRRLRLDKRRRRPREDDRGDDEAYCRCCCRRIDFHPVISTCRRPRGHSAG